MKTVFRDGLLPQLALRHGDIGLRGFGVGMAREHLRVQEINLPDRTAALGTAVIPAIVIVTDGGGAHFVGENFGVIDADCRGIPLQQLLG